MMDLLTLEIDLYNSIWEHSKRSPFVPPDTLQMMHVKYCISFDQSLELTLCLLSIN